LPEKFEKESEKQQDFRKHVANKAAWQQKDTAPQRSLGGL
jgi:hypothetical protein